MSTPNRATTLLEREHVTFETLQHRESFTSQGVAAACHVSGWHLAKVLLIHDPQGEPFVVVMPASCRLDMAELRRRTGRPLLTLAREDEMRPLFPDCEPGALPPFGNLYGLPVFVDACFPRGQELVFQAGNHHEAVRIKYEDFERLARPILTDVCCCH